MAKNQRGGQDLLSPAHEDYLRAIYLLGQRGQPATNQGISAELGVTPASATNMIKRLAELNLVTYTPYHDVELTTAGEKVALAVVRHHRLLELYLAAALGMPWERVHGEADRLEHAISDELADALARALGEPTADPHGDPIPGRDGSVEVTTGMPLTQSPLGAQVIILRVADQHTDTLRRLGELGLYPGTELTIQALREGEEVVVAAPGRREAVPWVLARQVYVKMIAEETF